MSSLRGRSGRADNRTTREPRHHYRNSSSPWDVVPGTHAEERFGPLLSVVLFAGIGWWLNHTYADTSAVGFVIFWLLILAGFMGWLAWRIAHGRDPVIRVHFGVTVGALFASLAGWTFYGTSQLWPHVYCLTGIPLAGSWLLYTTNAVRGDGRDNHEGEGSLDEMVKSARSLRHQLVESDGPRLTYRVTHTGATQSELQKTAETLASHAGIPPTGVRIVPDPDRADVSMVTLVAEDVLKTPIPFPGLSAPGTSCAVPSRIGIYEDSKPLEIVRPGDPTTGRPALRILIGGMPNAGKTEGELVELAELVSRKDVVIWWADPIKGAQTMPAFKPAVDWLADTQARCEAMVGALDDVIRARADLLGKLGYRQWEPKVYEDHGIPFMVIHFEEATRLLDAVGKSMTRLAEAVRSAGISISVSLQRPSNTNMPTDMRSQLGVGWSFGAQTAVDATMVLSEDTIATGARPEAWKDNHPGYCYLEASHVPSSRWSVPARTFQLDAKTLIAVVREWAPRMAKLDPWTEAAAGPAYAARELVDFAVWEAEMAAVHGPAGTSPRAVPLPPVPVPRPAGSNASHQGPGNGADPGTVSRETETPDDDLGGTMNDVRQALAQLHHGDEEVPEGVDGTEPIPPPDPDLASFQFVAPPDPSISPEQRARAFREVLVELQAEGFTEITVADVRERFSARPEGDITPGWYYYRLTTLAEDRHAFLVEKLSPEGERVNPRTWFIGDAVASSPLVIPEDDPELRGDPGSGGSASPSGGDGFQVPEL